MARGKRREAVDYSEIPASKTESEQKPSNVTNIFKRREIPPDRVFELRGKSGLVLHGCITTKCCKNLLEGISVKYPDLLEVGESTGTVIDGMHFDLVRTA